MAKLAGRALRRELIAKLADLVVGESQVPDLLDAIAMPWTPAQDTRPG